MLGLVLWGARTLHSEQFCSFGTACDQFAVSWDAHRPYWSSTTLRSMKEQGLALSTKFLGETIGTKVSTR